MPKKPIDNIGNALLAHPVEEDPQAVAEKIRGWTAEMRQLADKIATAKGTSCALVMITGTDEDYVDVAPDLILEDAMRINPYGWPQGFDIELINPTIS